ncbi:DinB family protein [Actinomadura parmotrematis]|uniref:DinB family protein n=1 Tax=Actinomadura parmotrematis TaxID=2864039 RepID=A0ABS7FNH1_9ACTN|nr:DinB family protein [Actinomadura parmotrematis]MBW8481137.1 DinB family protein [Actinomadura parmotrematis]
MITERPPIPLVAGERELLRAHLEYHRATLAWKCDGLDDARLRARASAPSALSLLGLVRHMAEVERTWFRKCVNGERDLPNVWSHAGDYQTAYDASASTRAEGFAAWRAEVEHARRIERAAPSLDLVVHQPRWGEDVSLRFVMLHMVHEYARHNGHADLIREAVDGTVGA